MLYEIKRHGGRQTDNEKLVYACYNREEAFAKWNELWIKVKQGSLSIYEDGVCIYKKIEPRLRTRW